MKPSNNQRKLKNYFMANKTQIQLMFANMVLVVLVFLIVTVMVIHPFYTDMNQLDDLWAQHYSAKFFIVLLERSALAAGVIFLLVLLNNFFINHKLCGPLVNFSNTYKRISQGDLTQEIVLRRHDFLKNEARQANDMIASLSSSIGSLKAESALLLEHIDGLTADGIEDSDRENEFHKIKKRVISCSEHLSHFKISDE